MFWEPQSENTRKVLLDSSIELICQEVEMGRYPGCEVHCSSSVQQQGGDIHVTIVSSDVQRGEPTLFETDEEK